MSVIALAEVRQRKNVEAVRGYLDATKSDIFILFAAAYFDYHHCLDRYEVRCNIERYERVEEVPVYVICFVKKRLN